MRPMRKSRDPWVTAKCPTSCFSPASSVTMITQHSTVVLRLSLCGQNSTVLFNFRTANVSTVQDSTGFRFGKQHGNRAYS